MTGPTSKKWDWDSIVEHVMINYRWVFVIFLLPVSFLFDVWFYTRSKIIFALNSAPTAHEKKVKGIQKQIREYHDSGSRAGMCTARPGNNLTGGRRVDPMTNEVMSSGGGYEVELKRYIRSRMHSNVDGI